MSCVNTSPPGCSSAAINCPGCDGCITGVCADFQIKKNDTRPPFKVAISDENGPMDLTGLVIEANMWASAKLKRNIGALDTSLALADNIGFCQILPNDIILMDRARAPEQMRIIGFNEACSLIFVERGFNGTVPQCWKRGTSMKIFRIMNASASSEMVFEDVTQVDGTVDCNVLSDSFLVYEWNVNDTCINGCFSFEFKVIKMSDGLVNVPSIFPNCFLGVGVEWTRRFPPCGEFLIKVCESPTSETFIAPSTMPLPSCIPDACLPVCPPLCSIPCPTPVPPATLCCSQISIVQSIPLSVDIIESIPLNVNVTGVPGAAPVLAYNEVTLVPSFATTTVVSYIVAAPQVYISGFVAGGTVNAWFKLQVNGTTFLSARSTVAKQTVNENAQSSSIIAIAGDTVKITVMHEVSGVQANFEGIILGVI